MLGTDAVEDHLRISGLLMDPSRLWVWPLPPCSPVDGHLLQVKERPCSHQAEKMATCSAK